MTNLKDYWFTTYTGKKFHIFDPSIDEIDIADIAHSLSLICRYGGHLPEHYSVAQHSVLVSHLVPEYIALEALLHDAEEAYTGDMIRPFKKHPGMTFFSIVGRAIEARIEEKFNLFGNLSFEGVSEARKLIKKADNIALLTEKKKLFKVAEPHKWDEEIKGGEGEQAREDIVISFVHPGFAKAMFETRFKKLWEKRNPS